MTKYTSHIRQAVARIEGRCEKLIAADDMEGLLELQGLIQDVKELMNHAIDSVEVTEGQLIDLRNGVADMDADAALDYHISQAEENQSGEKSDLEEHGLGTWNTI